MKRALLCAAAAFLASASWATPEIWDAYRNHYKLSELSEAFKAQCMNCHTTPPEHNAFGKFVKHTMLGQGTPKMLTPEVIRLIEMEDTDGDGWTNGDEAKAGFNPGDPKSHPPGNPPKPMDMNGGGNMKPQAMGESPFMPRHTFHPVIVHFPIALFIFGAFLDFLGRYRKDDVVRGVAFWNMVFGLLATLVAIPTGFIAAIRLGYPLQVGTPVFTHLSIAIFATLVMLSAVLWRRTGLVTHKAYWILLALAAAAVGVAGHFGGQMVYG